MNYLDKYNEWKNFEGLDSKLRLELENMNEEDIKDAFSCDLEFGTGGLRGVLGVGTNRMNYYIVRKATLGFGRFLSKYPNAKTRGVAISHDNRFYSKEFAKDTAEVLATLGFKVYLVEDLRPTPELSFAVRHYGCVGGIMITASHNPKEYNGYKIYGEDGCQYLPEFSDQVIEEINKVEDYFHIDNSKNHELIEIVGKELDEAYIKEVNTIRINKDIKSKLKVVYTPLHGTGQVFGPKVLEDNGFICYPLAVQMTNDPAFSGVKTSNPENKEAFDEAIEYAKVVDADIVLATDPDADRLGMAIKHNGEYVLLNGNQSATCMAYYIMSELKKQGKDLSKCYLFSTIVSSSLPLRIAESLGVHTAASLTGFKFLGALVAQVPADSEFIYAYEESYGCLVKGFVRDKDAIQAILMASELSAYLKDQGMDMVDYLDAIYKEYGYSLESQVSITLKGLDGKKKINEIMDYFRTNEIDFNYGLLDSKSDIQSSVKYVYGSSIITETIDLPKSNVIKYDFKCGSWFVLRPSGTEPKIKIYFSTVGATEEEASNNNQKLKDEITKLVSRI